MSLCVVVVAGWLIVGVVGVVGEWFSSAGLLVSVASLVSLEFSSLPAF